MIVDAHMHIWNRLHGLIGGKTPVAPLGNGMIQVGDKVVLGMPPGHLDSTSPAPLALADFDAAGVDGGVVVQEEMDGEQNDYCLDTMHRFPARFFCHALPDYYHPGNFAGQCDSLLARGFRGLKICGGHLAAVGIALDSPAFMPVWERLAAEGHILAVDLSEGQAQVRQMENILNNFPNLNVAIGHFGMPTRGGWPGQLGLCRHKNVHVESGGIIWLYRKEGFPFPGALAAIRRAGDTVGWEKLLWGSDWPRTMVDFTYRQSLDFVRDSSALTSRQRDLFLGQNAARLYKLALGSPPRSPVARITEG